MPYQANFLFQSVKKTPFLGLCLLLSTFYLPLSACNYLKKKIIGEQQKPLARAFDNYLYPSDVEDILKGRSPQDSARILKILVEKWLQRQLLLKKAKDNIPDDDPAIMRKVEDYRESLILYEYEKALISEKLDTAVSSTELEKYYYEFAHNYPLENDIYLVQFIKLKEDVPELKDFKKLLSNISTQEDEQRVEGYCKANAIAYAFAQPLWYNSEHLTSFFLLSDREIGQLVSSDRFRELNKEEGIITFIRVREVKRKGEQSPIELVRTEMAKVLLEKRKRQLIENFYNRVYKEGIASKNAEIYVQ